MGGSDGIVPEEHGRQWGGTAREMREGIKEYPVDKALP